MFTAEERKRKGSLARSSTLIAALLCCFTLSFSGVQSAHADQKVGKEIGYFSPSALKASCERAGGVYSPPNAGGTYICLLPDKSIVCTSDGSCTATFSPPPNRLSLQDILDIHDLKLDLIKVQLDLLNTQLAAIQNFLIHDTAPQADLLPVPVSPTSGPERFCLRNNAGQLLVKISNQGAGNAGQSITGVEFTCGNSQLCSGPTVTEVNTPELPSLASTEYLLFNIPNGCFNPNDNKCQFTIRADSGNTVIESNETNNALTGVCGAQFQ